MAHADFPAGGGFPDEDAARGTLRREVINTCHDLSAIRAKDKRTDPAARACASDWITRGGFPHDDEVRVWLDRAGLTAARQSIFGAGREGDILYRSLMSCASDFAARGGFPYEAPARDSSGRPEDGSSP